MSPSPISNEHYYLSQRPTVQIPQASSPGSTFRAGVIFTALLAVGIIAVLALAGTHDQQTAEVQNVTTVAGVAILPGVAVMGWAFVPVILTLSIITMCRGGIFRGILLLCGAPLSILLAFLIGAAVVVTTHEAAQAKLTTNAPPRGPELVTKFAPPSLALAKTESSVEDIRKDAIARLSGVAGLSETRQAALLREIDIACDARLAQISVVSLRSRRGK